VGRWMQKDELIQLHAFLLHIRNCLEDQLQPIDNNCFADYDDLQVQPQQLFKPKKDQQQAVFELCKGISKLLNINGPF
jgi:hypothetical protein